MMEEEDVTSFGNLRQQQAIRINAFFTGLPALQHLDLMFPAARKTYHLSSAGLAHAHEMQHFMAILTSAPLPHMQHLMLTNATFENRTHLTGFLDKHRATMRRLELFTMAMLEGQWGPFIRFLGRVMNLDLLISRTGLDDSQMERYLGMRQGRPRDVVTAGEWEKAARYVERS